MTSLEDLRNSLCVITNIVGESGELKGRVRLQKLGYLLQQRGFGPLAKTHFSYHHYGPYSDQLAGALEQVVASGLVQEVQHTTSNQRKIYSYKLNRQHPDNACLELTPVELDELRTVVRASQDATWRTLELAATVVYLERNLNLSRDASFTRALGLKPDCVSYQEQATRLLAELGFDPLTPQPALHRDAGPVGLPGG